MTPNEIIFVFVIEYEFFLSFACIRVLYINSKRDFSFDSPQNFNPRRFFDPRQNFMDPRQPRHSRQNFTPCHQRNHTTHAI